MQIFQRLSGFKNIQNNHNFNQRTIPASIDNNTDDEDNPHQKCQGIRNSSIDSSRTKSPAGERQNQLAQGLQTTSADSFTHLFHQVAISLDHLPFNSLEKIIFTNNELRLNFSSNVTKSMQDQAERTLKTRTLNSRWEAIKDSQSLSLIVLQEQTRR